MALMQGVLIVSREKVFGIVLGTLLDLSARQSDAERSFAPVHTTNPLRRDENTLSWQPIVCLDNKMANGPRLLFEEKVRHVTDQPV